MKNSAFSKTMFQAIKNLPSLFVLIFVVSLIHSIYIAGVQAQVIVEKLPDNKVFNDFVVGPGKIEMELSAGQSGTFDLLVSNRLGTNKTFQLSSEDFTGSDDPNQTVILLGSDRGPYSLQDFIKVGSTSLDIDHGSRVRIPVSVSIPKNAEPGGLYGSVIVSTMSKTGDNNAVSGVVSTNPIFTRIAVLIFIKIKGEVQEDGKLVDFSLAQNKKIVSGTDNLIFNLFYRNNGNIHLNPKGIIVIKNMLGSTVGNIDVEPWYAMPKSLRFREVSWAPKFLFGKYTATASIMRGYGEIEDEISYSFWAIPWKLFLIVFVVIVIVVALYRRLFRRSIR